MDDADVDWQTRCLMSVKVAAVTADAVKASGDTESAFVLLPWNFGIGILSRYPDG